MGRRYDKKGKGKKKASRDSDAALRLTYLWAAAHVLSQNAPAASSFYVSCIKQVGRRVTMPLDALTIKRHACKRCNTLLIPGSGARVRVEPRREKHVVVTCTRCGSVRRYLARPPREELCPAAQSGRENPQENVDGSADIVVLEADA